MRTTTKPRVRWPGRAWARPSISIPTVPAGGDFTLLGAPLWRFIHDEIFQLAAAVSAPRGRELLLNPPRGDHLKAFLGPFADGLGPEAELAAAAAALDEARAADSTEQLLARAATAHAHNW